MLRRHRERGRGTIGGDSRKSASIGTVGWGQSMNELSKSRRSSWGAMERAPSSAVYRALFEKSDLAFYVIAVMPDGSFRFEDANAAVAPFQIRPGESLAGSTPTEGLVPEIAVCLEEN